MCVTSFVTGVTVRSRDNGLYYIAGVYGPDWFVVLKTDAERFCLLEERAKKTHAAGIDAAQCPLVMNIQEAEEWVQLNQGESSISAVLAMVARVESELKHNHLDLVTGVSSSSSTRTTKHPISSYFSPTQPSNSSNDSNNASGKTHAYSVRAQTATASPSKPLTPRSPPQISTGAPSKSTDAPLLSTPVSSPSPSSLSQESQPKRQKINSYSSNSNNLTTTTTQHQQQKDTVTASSSSTKLVSSYVCQQCTFLNAEGMIECEVCGGRLT